MVLNKSQIPAVNGKKRALQELCKCYAQFFCEEITNIKISKKINNIKTEQYSDEFHHLRQLQPVNKESTYLLKSNLSHIFKYLKTWFSHKSKIRFPLLYRK
jgi:hypothetical protein